MRLILLLLVTILVHSKARMIENLKPLRILVIGDSLARRLTTQLAFTISENDEMPGKKDLMLGAHKEYEYRPITRSLFYKWAPTIANLKRYVCDQDIDANYDVVAVTTGIHDLEEGNSIGDYKSIVECFNLDTTLVIWRLPNLPTNRKSLEFRERFDSLRNIISNINGIETIDAQALYVDKGDTPEHTGFMSRQNVVDELIEIVYNMF